MTANPGWVEIDASAPAFAPRRLTTIVGSPAATARVTITLPKGFPVSGRVLDEHGEGLPGVRVFALQAGTFERDELSESATTAGDGTFTIAALAGSYALLASDDEHAPTRTPELDIQQTVTGIEIKMKAGAVYAGTVVDANDDPVPYARVHLARGPIASQHTNTDSKGAFEFRGLPRGPFMAYAESDAGVSPEAMVDLTQDLRGQTLKVELKADPNKPITGVVVDDEERPVVGATVSAQLRRVSTTRSSSTTDERGVFTLVNLPSGDYSVWAGKPTEDLPDERVTIAKPGDSAVRIKVVRKGAIKGKVVLAGTSTPPTWFIVDVDPRELHDWSTPGDNGAFEIRDLPPAMFALNVKGEGFIDTKHANVRVEPGKTTDVGTITVQRGRTLTGKVVDSSGRPVAGAKVVVGYGIVLNDSGFDDRLVGARSTATDQDGAFVVVGVSDKTNLGPTRLVVAADHPSRGRSLPTEVPDGAGQPPMVTLVLRASGSIAGRVTQGGKPIANAMIGAGWPEIGLAHTTDDGEFVISKLPEGPVVLRTMLQTEMFRPFSTTVVVVGGQQARVTIDVPIGTATLLVNVKARAGDPATAAMLFLFTGTVSINNYSEVAAQLFISSQGIGRWLGAAGPAPRFEKLVPGDYTVCALPLSKDPNTPGLMSRLREHATSVSVYCTPAKVASGATEQTLELELPAPSPLPP